LAIKFTLTIGSIKVFTFALVLAYLKTNLAKSLFFILIGSVKVELVVIRVLRERLVILLHFPFHLAS